MISANKQKAASGLFLLILFISFLGTSCTNDPLKQLQVDTSDIPVQIDTILRYEEAIRDLNTDPEVLIPSLYKTSQNFELFTGSNYTDPEKLAQLADFLNDDHIQTAFDSVALKYADLGFLKEELTELFKHYNYYFPKSGTPKVYTYISGYAFEQPVMLIDNSVVIALDIFLNPGFALYDKLGVPKYMQHRLVKERIASEVARAISIRYLPETMPSATLLQNMVEAGKSLYFTDAMLPQTPDYLKIGFTAEELEWCKANEAQIWSFVIDNKLLFSNKENHIRDFMMDGPFIPGMPRESPGELGHWLGWQIVRKYMEKNPDISLQDLMQTQDANMILRESAYKPKR